MAEWQSGYAADCKSVNAGSIPTSASKFCQSAILENSESCSKTTLLFASLVDDVQEVRVPCETGVGNGRKVQEVRVPCETGVGNGRKGLAELSLNRKGIFKPTLYICPGGEIGRRKGLKIPR